MKCYYTSSKLFKVHHLPSLQSCLCCVTFPIYLIWVIKPNNLSNRTERFAYLRLVGWWSTSSSSWPRRWMGWTNRIAIVVLWGLLARLPLLLGWCIWTRMCPYIRLGTGMEWLPSGVWGVWWHCVTSFTVVRVRTRRISRNLRAERGQIYVVFPKILFLLGEKVIFYYHVQHLIMACF